jgi:hypothetical protein
MIFPSMKRCDLHLLGYEPAYRFRNERIWCLKIQEFGSFSNRSCRLRPHPNTTLRHDPRLQAILFVLLRFVTIDTSQGG